MELMDKRNTQAAERWDNFMEIYLSRDGQMPVTQLGFGINWKTMLAWKTQLINDIVNVSGVPPAEVYGANFKLKEEKAYWHWRAAFSLEKLFGPGKIDRFKLNFRRKNPETRLCWNRFFASAQDCLEPDIMGTVYIRDMDAPENLPFAEDKFKNEVGTWRMLDGFIRFTRIPGEVETRFTGPKDALLFVSPVANRPGQKITVSCRADKEISVTLQPRKGDKRLPGKTLRMTKQKNGLRTAVFPPQKGDTFLIFFSSKKPEKILFSNVQVKFGK
jgi:hypothetical protein